VLIAKIQSSAGVEPSVNNVATQVADATSQIMNLPPTYS